MVSKARMAVVKILDPKALEQPDVVAVLEHEARLASDPAIQARNKRNLAEHRREMLPLYVIAALFSAAICGCAAWFMPSIVTPENALVAFAASLVFVGILIR